MWVLWKDDGHDGTAPAAAMITPFSMPCGKEFYTEKPIGTRYYNDRCAPPNFDRYWWSGVGFYSPAVCPSGYTIGCSRWDAGQGPPVATTETAMQCVPQ